MVKMKNIKHEGNFVTFDGYMNGEDDRHFTMKINLTDDSKSICSVEQNYMSH